MSSGVSLSHLSAVKLALMAEDMRARAAPVLRADPIAIVGMACRAPGGVGSPRAFWDLLAAGKKTTREIPVDRFDVSAWYDPDPAVPGKSQTRHGSFLDRVDLFDADYFGIVAREAEEMDPQQRLALEVSIEAIDDAGIPHAALRGSRTAVFMACYHSDYARLAYRRRQCARHAYADWYGPHASLPTASPISLTSRAEPDARHGVLVFARGGPSRLPKPSSRRERSCTRGRRIRYDHAGALRRDDEGRLHGGRRRMQDLRRFGPTGSAAVRAVASLP